VIDLTKDEVPFTSNYYPNNKISYANLNKKPEPKKIKPPPVQVPIKNNAHSVIDEEFMIVKKEEHHEVKDAFKKKGKKKGKPVDLDIKTGFFTVSQQEKNYEPMYICGDKDDQ
jgi:hypothetical protein